MDRRARETAAEILATARLERSAITRLPSAISPQTLSEAYDVQEMLHRHLTAAGHGALAGHKIGCTTPVMQAFLDIPNPCAGGVFAPTVHDIEGRFPHADFVHVGVECEIAVQLGADLDTGTYDRADVGRAVAAVMAAIEVVDDRYDDYRGFATPPLVADDFFNAGCVLGAPVTDWRSLDLAVVAGRMAIDGREIGRGVGGDIMGHPLEALAWLATMRAARGTPLHAGEFVLLGSVVATEWVERGAVVEVELDGLGVARAVF